LYFVTLTDGTLVCSLDRHHHSCFEASLSRSTLKRDVDAIRSAIDRDEVAALARASAPLYDALIAPAGLAATTTLVVIPDGPLDRLPFAALMQPNGRPLIEKHAIASAPSLTFLLRSIRPAPPSRSLRALTVGDGHVPNGSDHRRLPNADKEAAAVLAVYSGGTVLAGSSATKRQFLDTASRYDVVHFAGHSIASVERFDLGRFLFAPDAAAGDDGVLSVGQLEGHRFDRTSVVVLASCESAIGPSVAGEGTLNLARPFLAGGASAVLASLWAVDDTRSSPVFERFHRGIAAGLDPAHALRAAQLASSDQPVRFWSGLVVYGGVWNPAVPRKD
jgi:CHAT domain-containing protein